MNLFLMVEYGLRCKKVEEGLHPSERMCYVTGYLKKEGDDKKELEVEVGESSIKKIGDDSYLQVGVIPTLVIPHQKPSRLDRFLIEFPQEACDGSWRTWVDESSLVELTGED